MPSLSDIANDIKNTLNQIQTNTQDTASTVGLIKGDTADIKAELSAGFASLAAGIAVMIDQQKATNHLLDFERQQNETIICWLTNIADVLCRMLHRLNTQIKLQTSVDASLKQVKDTLELVHGTETVEVLRRNAIQAQLIECCPPPPVKEEPCYEPCRSPVFKPRESKSDYQPYQRVDSKTHK